MTQTSEKLVRPDVVGPSIPPEAPPPEVEPNLPQPGPDVVVRPGPGVTTSQPQEIPPTFGERG